MNGVRAPCSAASKAASDGACRRGSGVAGAGGVDGQVSGELVHSARDGHDSGELLHSARASDAAAPARRTEAATAAHEAACAAASARDAIRCAARPDKRQGERRVCTLLGWRKKTGLNHDHVATRTAHEIRKRASRHSAARGSSAWYRRRRIRAALQASKRRADPQHECLTIEALARRRGRGAPTLSRALQGHAAAPHGSRPLPRASLTNMAQAALLARVLAPPPGRADSAARPRVLRCRHARRRGARAGRPAATGRFRRSAVCP